MHFGEFNIEHGRIESVKIFYKKKYYGKHIHNNWFSEIF